MDKLALMEKYFVSESGAEDLLRKLKVISNFQSQLLSQGLIDQSVNKNSLFRILSRFMSILHDQLQSAHLELGIFLREEEDVYFWINDPYGFEEANWNLVIEADWYIYLQQLFEMNIKYPEVDLAILIPRVAKVSKALTVSIVDDSKISWSQFRAYIKSLRTRGRSIQGRKNRLLQLVQSGHGELISRVSDYAKEDEVIEEMRGVEKLRLSSCSGAPLNYQGLLTSPDYDHSYTYTRLGLFQDERLPKYLGRSWYRKRKALVAYLRNGLEPSSLVNKWGFRSFVKSQFGADIECGGGDFLDYDIKTSFNNAEKELAKQRESFEYYSSKGDLADLRYSIRQVNKAKLHLALIREQQEFAFKYFTNLYAVNAPSDWFDE